MTPTAALGGTVWTKSSGPADHMPMNCPVGAPLVKVPSDPGGPVSTCAFAGSEYQRWRCLVSGQPPDARLLCAGVDGASGAVCVAIGVNTTGSGVLYVGHNHPRAMWVGEPPRPLDLRREFGLSGLRRPR